MEPYLTQMVACANLATGDTVLTNKSQLVWAFNSFTPQVGALAPSDEARAFHAISQGFATYLPAFMVPGETVGLGANVRLAEWTIHPDLSSAWLAFRAMLDKVKSFGTEALKTAFTAGSKANTAVWNCTTAVFKARDLTATIATYDPMKQITSGLGATSSAGVCATSWKAAEREAGRARFPVWADDIATIGKGAKNASTVIEDANFLQRAVGILGKSICQVSPKFC